ALNKILANRGPGERDKAAEIAEQGSGMSSLKSHGSSCMVKFLAEGMHQAGTGIHRAASRFPLLKVQEGELLSAYKMLPEIGCHYVACHSGYWIR
ncbi:MAG: hypothetical protein OEM43_09435, partial [Gammaproteobacteria bacterium]|nr:hypothetical protein [Gammaproteobacteria bacterium]